MSITQNEQVIMITTELLGQGDNKLGAILMRNFLATLAQSQELPAVIILMNAGVKLLVKGVQTSEELAELEKRGVGILACGTCLDYYGLKEQVAAGEISNMFDITAALLTAKKVITL